MLKIDHIAIGCESLHAGVTWLSGLLGLEPDPGGTHPQMGTHNRLLRLGDDTYLELIAIDPDASPPDQPRWFGLDAFAGPPRLVGWVARSDRMVPPPGTTLREMRRGDLCWQLTVPDQGQMPGEGTQPLLIDWQGGPHPCDRLPDHGFRLAKLDIRSTDLPAIKIDDPRVVVSQGPPAMRALITRPDGQQVWV